MNDDNTIISVEKVSMRFNLGIEKYFSLKKNSFVYVKL